MRRQILFYVAFLLMYVSLFLGDVANSTVDFSEPARLIRLVSYAVICIQFFLLKRKAKEYRLFALVMLVSVALFFTSRDIYWSILALLVMSSIDCKPESIIRISMVVLGTGTLIVFLCSAIGILPDVMTSRSGNEELVRHSLGFYHSDVPPLLILYFELYYIVLKRSKTKYREMFLFLAVSILINALCDSRNGLYLSILIVAFIFIEKSIGYHKWIKKIVSYFSQFAVLLLSTFSYSMTILLLKGGIYNTIDTWFSGRFRAAIFKSNSIGISLIARITSENFFADGIVLDNGFLYIMLRYGILAVIIFAVINYLLVKKYKDDFFVVLVILVVMIANFVDNDLTDYSFLPFILLVFNRYRIGGKVNDKIPIQSKYSGGYKDEQ